MTDRPVAGRSCAELGPTQPDCRPEAGVTGVPCHELERTQPESGGLRSRRCWLATLPPRNAPDCGRHCKLAPTTTSRLWTELATLPAQPETDCGQRWQPCPRAMHRTVDTTYNLPRTQCTRLRAARAHMPAPVKRPVNTRLSSGNDENLSGHEARLCHRVELADLGNQCTGISARIDRRSDPPQCVARLHGDSNRRRSLDLCCSHRSPRTGEQNDHERHREDHKPAAPRHAQTRRRMSAVRRPLAHVRSGPAT